MSADKIVILDGARTPVGSFGGIFKDVPGFELGAIAAKEALSRSGVAAEDIGEVIMGTSFVKDFKASFTNFFGGRSKAYETELIAARDEALQEMQQRAAALSANAVVGVRIDYEAIGSGSYTMLMVTASGTAVRVS